MPEAGPIPSRGAADDSRMGCLALIHQRLSHVLWGVEVRWFRWFWWFWVLGFWGLGGFGGLGSRVLGFRWFRWLRVLGF